jgi:hypothetical protein
MGLAPQSQVATLWCHFFMAHRQVRSLLFASYFIARADRPSYSGNGGHRSVSMRLMKDGHFHLGTDESLPVAAIVVSGESKSEPNNTSTMEPRRITLDPVEQSEWPEVKLKLKTQPHPLHVATSSFLNRTTDWLALSRNAARDMEKESEEDLLASPASTPPPEVPQNRFTQKPKSWPERAYKKFESCYNALAPLRGGVGNMAATGAGVILGPDNCLLKILYVFFRMNDEDDYPYIPRGCGDWLDFALNADGIRVPWMLLVGAFFIVTGTHSTQYSLH